MLDRRRIRNQFLPFPIQTATSMSIHHPWSLSAFLFAMAILVGCSGTTDSDPSSSTSETSASADSPAAQPSSSEPGDDVQTPAAEDKSALDSVPEDLYIAENHSSAQVNEIGGKQNLVLEYAAGDAESFVETFHNGMKEKGWTLLTSSELPIGTIANFSKDDRKCTISIAPPKDQIIKVSIVLPSE